MRKNAAATAAKSNKAGGTAPVDLDPAGSHYLTLDPLHEATSFMQLLRTHAPHSLQTWQHSMQLARRKKRWLLAWRAIQKANSMQPDEPDAHYELMALVHHVRQHWDGLSDTVRVILEEEWTDSGRSGSLQLADVGAINSHFLQQHSASLPHRLAGQPASHAHSGPAAAYHTPRPRTGTAETQTRRWL